MMLMRDRRGEIALSVSQRQHHCIDEPIDGSDEFQFPRGIVLLKIFLEKLSSQDSERRMDENMPPPATGVPPEFHKIHMLYDVKLSSPLLIWGRKSKRNSGYGASLIANHFAKPDIFAVLLYSRSVEYSEHTWN